VYTYYVIPSRKNYKLSFNVLSRTIKSLFKKKGEFYARCKNLPFYSPCTGYNMVWDSGWIADRNQSFFP
jgi:hypothetical protein